MNLFQIGSKTLDQEQVTAFLQDNYVCIGYSGLGDLENISLDELKDRLTQTYSYSDPELTGHLQAIHMFVHTMQDGDYVLVADEEWVHLGDLGDYFYNDISDATENGTSHRRGVTWLKSVSFAELNTRVQEMFAESELIAQYNGPMPSARLDLWIMAASADEDIENSKVHIDEETITLALDILKEALRSEDVERRERAAIAILQYAK